MKRGSQRCLGLLWSAVVGVSISVGWTGLVFSEPGELFPDTPAYNERVNSPVSQQERSLKKPARVTRPTPKPVEKPIEKPVERPVERPIEKPVEKPVEQPVEKPIGPLYTMAPYATGLFEPLLTDKEQGRFDDEYAAKVTRALASPLDVRRRVSDDLKEAADNEPSLLKRYLLLHSVGLSIRGTAPLSDREVKAKEVLPLLTEETLAVQQARADCLQNLINGAPQQANDRLLEMAAVAHCTLARLQVKAGFPKEAIETLKRGRENSLAMKEKKTEVADAIGESQAWVDRGNQALVLAPRWQAILKENPTDNSANTQTAVLHLSLYGNICAAAPFAAKSDRADLKAFAAVMKGAGIASADATPSISPERAVKICQAMVKIAETTPVAFDKYSIAVFAARHLEQLKTNSSLSAEDTRLAKQLFTSAIDIAMKSGIRSPYVSANDPVAAVKPEKKADAPAANGKDDDGVFTSIGGIFADSPKDCFANNRIRKTGELDRYLEKNVIGKMARIDAAASTMGVAVLDETGKVKYVPVYFNIPRMDLRGVLVTVSIEYKLPAAKAEAARAIPIGTVMKVGGEINAVTITPSYYGEPPTIQIVISPK